ncbi:hypothetical protein C2S52_019644 [Perilla frutescens var. hirtella]|nr:hypothetical protein C2S52_019644 [Perilla frutescens var. hirtella]
MADLQPRRELNLKKVAAAQKRKAEEENISTSDSDADHREIKYKKKNDPRAAEFLARIQQDSDWKTLEPDVEQHLFYVDRVVLGYRTVPRSIPATIKWTNELITARQSMEVAGGGFGEGFPDKPCTVDEILNPDFIDNELINTAAPNQPAPNEENVVAAPPVVNEQPFVDEPEPNNPAEPPCEQAGLSEDTWEDERNVVENNGIASREEGTTKDNNRVDAEETEKQIEEDNEVENKNDSVSDEPQNIAKQDKGKGKMHADDAPTFSLGFSQDIWEDVMNVVDEIESTTKDKNKGDTEEIEKNVEKGNEVQIKGKTKMHTKEDVQMKGQVKEKEPDRMVTRNKNLLKKTEILVSPYYSRAVVADEKLDKKQKFLYYWMMCRSESNRYDKNCDII